MIPQRLKGKIMEVIAAIITGAVLFGLPLMLIAEEIHNFIRDKDSV